MQCVQSVFIRGERIKYAIDFDRGSGDPVCKTSTCCAKIRVMRVQIPAERLASENQIRSFPRPIWRPKRRKSRAVTDEPNRENAVFQYEALHALACWQTTESIAENAYLGCGLLHNYTCAFAQ